MVLLLPNRNYYIEEDFLLFLSNFDIFQSSWWGCEFTTTSWSYKFPKHQLWNTFVPTVSTASTESIVITIIEEDFLWFHSVKLWHFPQQLEGSWKCQEEVVVAAFAGCTVPTTTTCIVRYQYLVYDSCTGRALRKSLHVL